MAKPFDEIRERPKYSTKLLELKENSGNHMTEFTHSDVVFASDRSEGWLMIQQRSNLEVIPSKH